MLEIYINSKFEEEREALRKKFKNFLWFYIANTEKFDEIYKNQYVTFENNPKQLDFKLLN
ncbi:MAG: hypothetical protein PHY59_09620 [Methanobacterium sp.]|nr:hypothetical protein [Methanobacterium sp.]